MGEILPFPAKPLVMTSKINPLLRAEIVGNVAHISYNCVRLDPMPCKSHIDAINWANRILSHPNIVEAHIRAGGNDAA